MIRLLGDKPLCIYYIFVYLLKKYNSWSRSKYKFALCGTLLPKVMTSGPGAPISQCDVRLLPVCLWVDFLLKPLARLD